MDNKDGVRDEKYRSYATRRIERELPPRDSTLWDLWGLKERRQGERERKRPYFGMTHGGWTIDKVKTVLFCCTL